MSFASRHVARPRSRTRTARPAGRRGGDAVKESMKQILRSVAAARQDGISVDVSGLDQFDIGDFSAELEDAEKLLKL